MMGAADVSSLMHPIASLMHPVSAHSTLQLALACQLVLSSLVSCACEVRGWNLGYSKFASTVKWPSVQAPTRVCFTCFYLPAALLASLTLVASAGFAPAVAALQTMGIIVPAAAVPEGGWRFPLFAAAVAIHFGKRTLETLFLHRFSGTADLLSAAMITVGYFTLALMMIAAQGSVAAAAAAAEAPSTLVNLAPLGCLLFAVGIAGNLYHHYLLTLLRNDGSKRYKVPEGGLFHYVACPHYLLEIVTFIGMAFIGQNLFVLATAIFTILYLTGRSIATRKWYLNKLEDFPRKRRALVPFIL